MANPTNVTLGYLEWRDDDFHLAAGMIRGLLYKAGHKFDAES